MLRHNLLKPSLCCVCELNNCKSHAKSLCRLGRIVQRAEEFLVDIVDVAEVTASNQRMEVMHRIKAGQNRVCEVAVFSLLRFLRAAAHDAKNPVKYQDLQQQRKSTPANHKLRE